MERVRVYETEGKTREERESVFPPLPNGVKNGMSKRKEGAGI